MPETKSSKSIMTNEPEITIDRPLGIGDRCDVKFRNGDHRVRAKVVERRHLDPHHRTSNSSGRKRKTSSKNGSSPPPPDLDTLQGHEVEYYVHYENHDRRLDQWITLDKFILASLERAVVSAAEEEGGGGGGGDIHGLDGSSTHSTRNQSYRRSSSTGLSNGTTSGGGGSGSDENAEFTQNDDDPTASSFLSGGNWRGASGDPSLAALEREHEETTKVKNIDKIYMGGWEVECWYYSPYPDEYQPAEMLYVCEYCLKYCRKARTFREHKARCQARHPPGREIYRELGLSVYEVDGKEERVYCQNLCLLSKLFLDHKTLYYDVDPFYFYVICSVDDSGAHIVGYFSKEKISQEDYNLACILTFPQHQKHGYGKFIISLSYELTKREHKTGSPEKPLSDLGKISYRSYWKHILLHLLANHDPSQNISIKDIAVQTGIKTEDIISTLQYLDMIKCWKGQHVVYVKQSLIDEYMKQGKTLRLCKPECLDWAPTSK